VKEIRAKQLPPLDDALAQKITNNTVQTLAEFKDKVREDLSSSLESSSEVDLDTKLVDQIIENSTVKFPPVLLESEVEDQAKELMERLDRQGITLDAYLQRTGKTREELTSEFQTAAEKRIAIGLVLGEVAEKESLYINDEDMSAAIAAQAEDNKTTPAAMRAYLETNKLLSQLGNQVQTKKVLDFLRSNAIIKDKIVKAGESDEDGESKTDKPAKAPKKTTKPKASKTE
jgi:trigger factor